MNFSGLSNPYEPWSARALPVCSAVARIGEDRDTAVGTGFLLDGELLCPCLSGEIVLLTNAHLVSYDRTVNKGALDPKRAVATLHAVDPDLELRFVSIIRSSPMHELDTTIIAFDTPSRQKLRTLKAAGRIAAYTLACNPDTPRIYIIGYPYGGDLQISADDSPLLACNDRFLQYRTPTDQGSSGSPIFNECWELIGMHHAGGPNRPTLDDPTRTHAANEGIRIDAISRLFD